AVLRGGGPRAGRDGHGRRRHRERAAGGAAGRGGPGTGPMSPTRAPDLAITRDVSPSLARCELTFLAREPIDVDRAAAQHRAYCDLLEALGLMLRQLPGDAALPDCCFVEDTAVVLDEIAVLTHPGAPSRRGEVAAVAEALAPHRSIARIPPSATLDGGDVLVLGRRIYTGRTARTTGEGARALQRLLAPFRYRFVPP